ncbi:glycosyltransferase [Limibaculum sp. FT325]|uniref:glycosyltransferase n=1 Tax=Thermohalobaculum sediminis TaxID=2939436 RepID=UPI0020BD767A|nr:glycosyltransferase [Limibaculum sediminis]MCL5776864.1 glycosyltransferase [Limibaculum sediminis]
MNYRRGPLAIAAPSFSEVSETFIRAHVRTIMPGATIIISQNLEGAEEMGVPMLAPCPSWEPPRSLPERIVKSVGARFRRHVRADLRRDDFRRAVAFFEEHNPSALLVEYLDYAANFVNLAHATRTPLYAYAHGYEVAAAARVPRVGRHVARVFRAAAGVFVASEFMRDKLIALGCSRDKLFIAPYGIDQHRFKLSSAEPGRIIAVGRLVAKKAPDKTLAAFSEVLRRHSDARLDLVGDGELMPRCSEIVAAEGMSNAVTLHGALPTEIVAEMMGRASIFVQHSVTAPNGDTEGLGVSLLEAMASGVPVVATRHNGFVETVADGETGLLVDEHDINGMAEAISALLTDPDRARRMGMAGRARLLSHFTEARCSDRIRAAMQL